MAFFPKKHLQWREPKAFLQLKDAEERAKRRWWHLPFATLLVAAMMMLNWYLARFDPRRHPFPFNTALMMAVGSGIIFSYGLTWIITLCPSEIRLYDTFISLVRGNSHWRIKYSKLEYFSWRMTQEHTTLILKQVKSKRELLIGLPSDTSQYEVNLFFLSRGVMQRPK